MFSPLIETCHSLELHNYSMSIFLPITYTILLHIKKLITGSFLNPKPISYCKILKMYEKKNRFLDTNFFHSTQYSSAFRRRYHHSLENNCILSCHITMNFHLVTATYIEFRKLEKQLHIYLIATIY